MATGESGYVDFPRSDYPDIIPGDFKQLTRIGKKEVSVELLGIRWQIATLEEWEEREIEKRLSTYDLYTREKLRPVEVLTNAIVRCVVTKRNKQEVWDFSYEDKKGIIRSVLLILDPKVVKQLYTAYRILFDLAKKEFDEAYPDVEKEITKEIIGQLTKKEEPQGNVTVSGKDKYVKEPSIPEEENAK